MPLVTSKTMLANARKGGYAVGAFNVENMEMVKAVIAAAEELRAPVMLQTTPSTVKYGSLETYAAIVAAETKKATVPVCLHLDHGSSYELAVAAMEAGYTSVMIDGSHESFEDNIEVKVKTNIGIWIVSDHITLVAADNIVGKSHVMLFFDNLLSFLKQVQSVIVSSFYLIVVFKT